MFNLNDYEKSDSERFNMLYQMIFDYHKEQSGLSCLQNITFVDSVFYNMKVVKGYRHSGQFITDDIILHIADSEQEDRIYDRFIDEGIVLKFNCMDLDVSNDKMNNVFKTWFNIISAGDLKDWFASKLTMMKEHFDRYKPADYNDWTGEMPELPPHPDPIVEKLIRMSDIEFDDFKTFLEEVVCKHRRMVHNCIYLYFTDVQYLLENDIAARKFIRMWYNIKSEFYHYSYIKLVLSMPKSVYKQDDMDMLMMKIKRLDKEFTNIIVFE